MSISEDKKLLRREVRQRLETRFRAKNLPDAVSSEPEESQKICRKLAEILKDRTYFTVLTYLSFKTELPTPQVNSYLYADMALHNITINNNSSDKQRTLVFPWCQDDRIELFRLPPPKRFPVFLGEKRIERDAAGNIRFDDLLAEGRFGLSEPRRELRGVSEYWISPERLDAVLVPGLAFDLRGARLGRGGGFYDRLLACVRPDCLTIGLAFAEQCVERVPTAEHDRRMDYVIFV